MTLREWADWQMAVLRRWFRRNGGAPTPETVAPLAARFAEKHSERRYRAAA